jgi:hypothetical protein
MAATGYTPISLYYSSTTSNQPAAGDLVYGELAINITDGKLYYKNNSNVVTLLASSAIAALTLPITVPNGGTGLTTLATGFIPYGNGTGAFSSSANLEFDGTTLVVGPGSQLGGTTNPYLAIVGNTNSYIQAYIHNSSSGTTASADFAVYPDNGLDSSGWVDMGITSSTYSDAGFPITVANEGYILMSAPAGASKSGNLVYATDSTGTANFHQWYVGGFTAAKTAWKMQLTSTLLQTPNVIEVSKNTGTLPALTTGTLLQLGNVDGTQTRVLIDSFGTGTSSGIINRRSNGTAASPSALLADNNIAVWASLGYGTTGYSSATRQSIQSFASENWTDSAQGTYLSILTTATGTTTTTEKWRVGPSGEFGIGGANYGTAGQVLTSGGAGGALTWTTVTPGTGTVTSITAGTGLTGGTITSSGTIAIDTAVVATTSNSVTLTNKRITPRIGTVTSASTITPTSDLSDQYNVTALAVTATFAIPSGTPTNGQKLTIRIKDNGTGQTLNWTSSSGGYRVIGSTLPTSTTASKTIYVGCIYNSQDNFWDVVSVATEA